MERPSVDVSLTVRAAFNGSGGIVLLAQNNTAKQEGFSNLGRNLIVQAVELLREAPGFANMNIQHCSVI